MNNAASTTEFSNSLQHALDEMQREWARLHAEIAELRTERDQLKKALLSVMFEDEDEITLTKEEILAQCAREKPTREFLEEIRRQLAGD